MPPRKPLDDAYLPALPFTMLVLSENRKLIECVRAAMPSVLGVGPAARTHEVRRILAAHPVVVGVIADLERPLGMLDEMIGLVRGHAAVRVLGVLPRRGVEPMLDDAWTLGGHFELADGLVHPVQRQIADFARRELDRSLHRAARLIAEARSRQLDRKVFETFVCWSIRQVPRGRLKDVAGVSEGAIEQRVARLSRAWGMKGLGDVARWLLTLPDDAPRRLVRELEQRAISGNGGATRIDCSAGRLHRDRRVRVEAEQASQVTCRESSAAAASGATSSRTIARATCSGGAGSGA